MMFRRWFRGSAERRFDDRGSMPMAMLVITIGLVSSALLTPIVVRQFTATRSLVARNTELNAAQTGLDVMMAQVRAASAAAGSGAAGRTGLLENLPPCGIDGNAGAVGTSESLPYHITVVYRDQDGNAMTSCPPTQVPTTATVTSVGYGADGAKRTLTATYIFSTSNTTIPGGAIRIDTTTASSPLCFDAGAAKSPAAGTRITMQPCNGSSRQQFGYTSDLYLRLVNSEATGAADGMCLYAGPMQPPARSHAGGDYLNFQACLPEASGKAGALFQWSLDGSSQFHATNSNQGIENLCVNVQTPGTIGSYVVLGSCGSSLSTDIFRSEPGVGAGMAGYATNQLVNYAQFSRCLDVTNQDPGQKYMIAWFCKQSPNSVVDWNQIWKQYTVPDGDPVTQDAVSVPANIVVTKSGTRYCLTSPLSNATNIYVTVTACPSTTSDKSMVWTVVHDTGDYGTSYVIKDSKGYCLTPTDLNAVPKDTHSDGTSKVKVATCDGHELQKWNAPANIDEPTPFTDLTEN